MANATGHTESGASQAMPLISALFLVVFDQKIGYSISYKRAVADVQLDGVVEYKSLPSGLHNVQNDLVYFVHDDCAGISAFVSRPAGEAERNAHFVAVGVLVPLTYGRLGRSWLHAAALRELAELTVDNVDDTSPLEEYWEKHRSDGAEGRGQDGSKETNSQEQTASGRRKARSSSDAALLGRAGHTLSDDHPAILMRKHLDTFGPLLFPLYRAALLRKRILILTHTPVKEACDLVYNISVLSNTPSHLVEILPQSETLSPIRPLFNVGVHDIPHLASFSSGHDDGDDEARQGSYIACSTDEILATKNNIYDILVELPQEVGLDNSSKQWPKLRSTTGESIKATQRDLRRYRALRKGLRKIQRSRERLHGEDDEHEDDGGGDQSETAPLTQAPWSLWDDDDDDDEYSSFDGEASVVESTSWTAMAYTGFLWWASAGERDAWLEEEACQDATLLEDLPVLEDGPTASLRQGTEGDSAKDDRNIPEDATSVEARATAMLLIAFAHRLTVMTMENMVDVLESTDDTGQDEADQEAVLIRSDDLRRMGLDAWSDSDKGFARELSRLYFKREAEVRSQGVECCGLKIC